MSSSTGREIKIERCKRDTSNSMILVWLWTCPSWDNHGETDRNVKSTTLALECAARERRREWRCGLLRRLGRLCRLGGRLCIGRLLWRRRGGAVGGRFLLRWRGGR